MRCKRCETIQKDETTGLMVCITCGRVFEDSQIVQTIDFDANQKASGTLVDSERPHYFGGVGRNTLNKMYDPLQLRINKIYKYMMQVSKTLMIPTYVVERAKKLYNIASNKRFTQGRKTKVVVGAILYLACRWDCTQHLLIDFSEIMKINMYLIGTIYLKLVRILNLKIKIIEPSLFMHRFISKFNFGDKAKEIEFCSLKLLQFFKRDWITTGRRPSGLCGACILIAAKLNNFLITIKQISDVVHIGEDTIKKRLGEFSETKVAKMTKKEFDEFKEIDFYPGMEPPSYLKNIYNNTNIVNNADNINNDENKINENIKKEDKSIKVEDNDNNNSNNIKIENNNIKDESGQEGNKKLSIKKENFINDDKLSLITENENNKYFFSDKEYEVRKAIWMTMFKDWMDEQKEKDEKKQEKQIRKPRIKNLLLNKEKNKNPFDAIKNSKKFGSKINYNYLKSIMNKK